METITDILNHLSIGTHKQATQVINSQEWYIINVSGTKATVDDMWIPLAGSSTESSSQQQFEKAVTVVRNAINQYDSIFVYCIKGQSRSVSVASTAIAAELNSEYDIVLEHIISHLGNTIYPVEPLSDKGRAYIRHTV